VQWPALKLPEPSELKPPTVPVGVSGVPGEVSVTVAVHVVDWSTATGLGEQLRFVEADRGSTFSFWLPLLALWSESPP